MNEVACARRAERVAQRAGVALALIRAVLEYADIELAVGAGRVAIRVSDEVLHQLEQDQGTALADKARHIILIVSAARPQRVLGVMRTLGQPSRRYLRRAR